MDGPFIVWWWEYVQSPKFWKANHVAPVMEEIFEGYGTNLAWLYEEGMRFYDLNEEKEVKISEI